MKGGDYTQSWHEELLPKARISQVVFAGLKLYLLTHWRQKGICNCNSIFNRGILQC